jgi:hypothetical protein
MRIQSLSDLTAADERTLIFSPWGLGGQLRPEDAADFQQRCIAGADLIAAVPEHTTQSFERLRDLHSYGVLWYDAFTLTNDLRWVVLELAVRERFIEFYDRSIPLIAKDGSEQDFAATNFATVFNAFRRRGSHAKCWDLRPRSGSSPLRMPLTLDPLLRWARHEGLLAGQRNRILEREVFSRSRNRFAHGDYWMTTPNHSARAIHDTAEIINRLWGADTPGGRLYPAPIQRAALVVGWSSPTADAVPDHATVTMHCEQLASHKDDGSGWEYIIIRGVWTDESVSEFDARYELTAYPTELLWGPGDRLGGVEWLSVAKPSADEVTYLDRVFAIRRDSGKVYLPCRIETFLGLPRTHHSGNWHLVRADFPNDALGHIRHVDAGDPCPATESDMPGCPVEDLIDGTWSQVEEFVCSSFPSVRRSEWVDVHVPRRWPLPETIGCD